MALNSSEARTGMRLLRFALMWEEDRTLPDWFNEQRYSLCIQAAPYAERAIIDGFDNGDILLDGPEEDESKPTEVDTFLAYFLEACIDRAMSRNGSQFSRGDEFVMAATQWKWWHKELRA